MVDLDLLYVTYRQQELWHEAAAQAPTVHVHPTRPHWWARGLGTLKTRCSDLLRQASRHSHPCPVPAVVRVAPPREERKHRW